MSVKTPFLPPTHSGGVDSFTYICEMCSASNSLEKEDRIAGEVVNLTLEEGVLRRNSSHLRSTIPSPFQVSIGEVGFDGLTDDRTAWVDLSSDDAPSSHQFSLNGPRSPLSMFPLDHPPGPQLPIRHPSSHSYDIFVVVVVLSPTSVIYLHSLVSLHSMQMCYCAL